VPHELSKENGLGDVIVLFEGEVFEELVEFMVHLIVHMVAIVVHAE